MLFLISPVSASWITDLWGKISGKTVDDTTTIEVQSPSQFPKFTFAREEQKNCCFCAYDDQKDSSDFLKECNLFFDGKAHLDDPRFSCDVKETVKLSEWESQVPELLKQHKCKEPVHIYHAAHGPVCNKIVQLIQVCVSNAPTCDLDVKSTSCQSFQDLEEVENYFRELQQQLGPDITITACGNRLNSLFGNPDCTLTSIVKVSQKEFSITPGPCKPQGTLCSPPDKIAYDCTNAQGQRTKQICCRNTTSLLAYSRYETGRGFTPFGSTGFSPEGETSCPLPLCANEGSLCILPGRTYACLSPNGTIANQSCCLKEFGKYPLSNFEEIGKSCSLPSCTLVNEGIISCYNPRTKASCKNEEGAETYQVCCGLAGLKIAPIDGFLSEVGKECDCRTETKKGRKLVAISCLTRGQDVPFLPNRCFYDKTPQGKICGRLRDGSCDDKGLCTKNISCNTDKDCIRKGKKYCALEEIETIATQQCIEGVCNVSHQDVCKAGELCKETATSASCVRQQNSKTKRFISDLGDILESSTV